MLQADFPDIYILATNKTVTVREFLKLSFACVDIDIVFEGEGVNEIGFEKKSGNKLIQINKDFFRPVEVDLLVGDYSHAKEKLGWEPSCSLEDLCKIMVEADLARN